MRISNSIFMLLILLFSSVAHAQLLDDDGDGVPNDTDNCLQQDASGFDVDGDGCIDTTANARHIEYWAEGDLPFSYVIHSAGAPFIADGSDFAAIQAGFDAWTDLPDSRLEASYGGTTGTAASDGMDGIHQVTFQDPDFLAIHGSAVLAVGLTTSFEIPTNFLGRDVRPGQIVDADMLFNPNRTFSTDSAGVTGIDLFSVALHEAGHLFGISHSLIEAASMFPALPAGTAARSFHPDDELMAFMADPEPAALANATILEGVVTNGLDLSAIRGAALYAINAATEDTSGCTFTFPDGSYRFVGLPPADYNVFVHPLDGSLGVQGVTPGLVNELVQNNVDDLFVAEWWDVNESSNDNSADRSPISLTAGSTAVADIITNVDTTEPHITDVQPEDLRTDVRIDTVILLEFDEAIDLDTAPARIRVERLDVTGSPVEQLFGPLTLITNDDVLIFNPNGTLEYATDYRITVKAGLSDVYGNGTINDHVTTFRTEEEPALAISSILPGKGVPETLMVLAGSGFSEDPASNFVMFGGTPAVVQSAAKNRLTVNVPIVAPGDVDVSVTVNGLQSNTVLFTALTTKEIVRGNSYGDVALAGTPRDMVVLPDGTFGYIATSAGVSVVSLSAGQPDHGQEIKVLGFPGGIDGVDVTPDGRRIYAVSRATREIHVIISDYVDLNARSALFNTLLASLTMSAEPLDIAVDPVGGRAFIPTREGTIQIWDVLRELRAGTPVASATFHRQIGEIDAGVIDLIDAVALSPDGRQVLVARATGRLISYSTDPGNALLVNVPIGSDPRDLAVDPLGLRCYIADGSGGVDLVTLSTYAVLPQVETGGSTRGVAVSAGSTVGFAADTASDVIHLIDLDANNVTFRSVAGDVEVGGAPIDVVLDPGGLTAYVLEQDPPRMRFLGIGFGPILQGIYPDHAVPGTIVALRGSPFAAKVPGGANISTPQVAFGETIVDAIISDGEIMYARVPSSFTGGDVRVRNLNSGAVLGEPLDPFSNPLFLSAPQSFYDDVAGTGAVLASEEYDSVLGYDWGQGVRAQIEMIPFEDLVVLADVGGQSLLLFDVRPGSPTFEQVIRILQPSAYVQDFAAHPDGSRLFVSTVFDPIGVDVFDTDRDSPTFGQRIATVDFDYLVSEFVFQLYPDQLEVSPGGEFLLVNNTGGASRTIWVELRPDIGLDFRSQYEAFAAHGAAQGTPINNGMAIHPSNYAVYVVGADSNFGRIYVFGNLESESNFLQQTAIIPVDNSANGVACSLDGAWLFVATRNLAGTDDFKIYTYDLAADPYAPNLVAISTIDAGTATEWGHIEPLPTGDRILVHTGIDAILLDVNPDGSVTEVIGGRTSLWSTSTNRPDLAITPDGRRAYAVRSTGNPVKLLPHRGESLWIIPVSGENQIGVAGQPLPAPIRIRMEWGDQVPRPGSTILARVIAGGGSLENGQSQQYLNTDANGEITVNWTLGAEVTPIPAPAPGNETHRLEFSTSGGFAGNAIVTATAVADPGTLPLDLAQVLPVPNSTGIGIGTAVSLTFSRAVDRATIGSTTFFLQESGNTTLVPGVYGFANGDRTVTILPLVDLLYSTTYSITVTNGVMDTAGGVLQDPGITTFQTQLPPILGIGSISPPSATIGAKITLAGGGFDAITSQNTVRFNGNVTAKPFKGGSTSLEVYVPIGAITGNVVVESGGNTSNARPFTVLVPTDAPLDEILASVQTGVTAHNMAVLPNGSKAYSVSTETNEVQVVDLVNLATLGNIAVGNEPVSLIATPDGNRVYVANFVSGTLSVIDTATDQVTRTIKVGPQPLDIVVSADGKSVYVVTVGDQVVSRIDADPASGTYNSVTLSSPAGANTKGAAISPDGTILYLGVSNGFLIFELGPSSFGATTSVPTGASTKGVAITPDGTLLILVTLDGGVLVVDVSEGGGNQVVTSIPAGANTKGAAISPDGTLLYLLPEIGDEIVVIALDVQGSVSKAGSGALGGLVVTWREVDRFSAGESPSVLVFDPSGSGLTIVANGGSFQGYTFLNSSSTPFGLIDGTLEVTPRTLNLQSKGRFITAHLELPEEFSVRNIQLGSVLLNDVLIPNSSKTSITDENQDGVEELSFKFDRFEFQQIMPHGESVPVKLTGQLDPDNRPFEGNDFIRTIRPTVIHPAGAETFLTGTVVEVLWTSPAGYAGGTVDVEWSQDDGETWNPIAMGVANTGSQSWLVPDISTDVGLLAVTLYDDIGDDIGVGVTNDRFGVNLAPIPVAMGGVDVSVENGVGVLRWTAAYARSFAGFHVLRSSSESGPYDRVTQEPLVGGDGGFVFRDEDIHANRAYWYMLEEVESGDRHGPYKLSYVLRSSLAAAVPNPFNPRTMIQFSVAREGRVRLVVYDVAGRRVRTLRDEILRPDVYTVVWDGTDERSTAVASGIYLYRLEAPGYQSTKKMVLIR